MPHRLYNDLTDLWIIASPPEDYETEADAIAHLLQDHCGQKRLDLLELGCGAGGVLSHLAPPHRAVGIDLSPEMVAHSQRVNPEIDHHVADMRAVRLDWTFDAVLAHDSLDYMVTEDDLAKAFATAAAHLEPGGLFLAAASHVAETFVEHETATDRHVVGNTELVHFAYVHCHPSGQGIELVMVLLVREDGKLNILEDRHHCGLHPMDTWLRLLDEAGFDVEADIEAELGPQFIAVKR